MWSVWLGAGWEVFGGEWVTGLCFSVTNSGESGICVLVAVVWVVLGESGWAACARGLGGWGVVMSVCVVSLDSLC